MIQEFQGIHAIVHHCHIMFWGIGVSPKEILNLSAVTPILLSHTPLGQHQPFYNSSLGLPYKRAHIICGFVHLTSFTEHDFSSHPWCGPRQ